MKSKYIHDFQNIIVTTKYLRGGKPRKVASLETFTASLIGAFI